MKKSPAVSERSEHESVASKKESDRKSSASHPRRKNESEHSVKDWQVSGAEQKSESGKKKSSC